MRKRLDLDRPVPLVLVKECLEVAAGTQRVEHAELAFPWCSGGSGTAPRTSLRDGAAPGAGELHLNHEREIGVLLGVPATVRQAALLPTAYFTGETFKPAPRQPWAEVLHVDGW